ncbi:MAG TPA: 3-isopropylmalate dehydrogenase, partial [Burkholderiales bacterium]|nr:3-isopropylmalate dehydrogenase [Burkholderiales bacterium]
MKIAILAGDGIGPEIVAQAVKILRALGPRGFNAELQKAPIG